MNKRLRLIYLLLLLFGISIRVVTAQSDFGSEEEFKKQAAKLFSEEEFVKAYPLYSQLVSLYRKDPNYNYRLGVCMLYAGTGEDKERAIFFLEFAANSTDVEKERLFYLAKAYHLNYRFDDAITQYKKYKKIASSAKAERLQVDRQIEMCKNGKNLLRTINDLTVIDKTEMNREDFFRAYNISGIGGKLLVKPDEKEFRTTLDKKKNEQSIIYLASNGNQIFFSSYGDNDQHGKDIYEMKKLQNGEWGKPQTLGKTINTDYDEDYPFLHPNGKVLYFCSKGHNSMGGYDIFKSTLNEETKTWNEPENLNFPINTPDDDILYITDSGEKKAYFSSARSSVAGKITVYHINTEHRPVDVAYIKGNLIKNRDRQTLDAKITVKNLNDNTVLGVYNTKPATGSYDIKLPNGGRFLFTVEATDFTAQSEIVTVPVQTEFKPLKQEMSFSLQADKLTIKNSFDEVANDTTYMLAVNFIKEKSKLDVVPITEPVPEVIVSKEENPTAEENATEQPTTEPKVNTKLTNDDIVKIANKDADDADTEAKDTREQADIALDLANQKSELAKGKLLEVTALMAAASQTQDNIKKQALTDEANAVGKDAEQLNKEMVVTFNLAKKLDMTASAKQEEADLSHQYAKGLEEAVKSHSSNVALAKLAVLEKRLDSLSQVNADHFPVLNSFKKEQEYKKRELDNSLQLSKDLKGEIADNETIISNLKADAEKTKSSQEKKGMSNQIDQLIQENSNKQKALAENETKKARIQKEYNNIKNETELASTVIDQSKTATGETAAAKVATIDKNKLEQQVKSVQSSEQTSSETASANTTGDNASSETITATKNTALPNTTAKALIDINKKYETDLTSAEKIVDKDTREKEKASVFKKWAEAIDADVMKQKQDLSKTTDPEMKALLAKKINDAENSSKEKQKHSDESLEKVKKVEQKNIPTDVGLGTTYGNNNIKDSTAKADSLKVTASKETKADTKAAKVTPSENAIKESQKNKLVAAQQLALANKADHQTNQKELDQYSAIYSTNAAAEISTAKKNSDEAKVYFDNAQKLRAQAETADSYSAKETANENASKNEMLALEKQKAAIEIYKNFKSGAVAANPNTNVKGNAIKNTTPISKTNAAGTSTNAAENEKQSSYNTPASIAQIAKADSLDKQAADLMEQSVSLKSKALEQKSDPAAQNATYAKSEELIKQANGKKLQSSQLIATTNKSEYTANRDQLEQLTKVSSTNSSADLLKAEVIKEEANKYFDKAQKQRADAASADSYSSKESSLEEARKNETIALQKQKESIAIYNKNNSNSVANNLNVGKATVGAAVITPPIPVTKAITITGTADNAQTNNSLANNPVANTVNYTQNNLSPVVNEVFEQKARAAYNAKHPIPINEKLPEGLIYKVQIGAFRKPIPQDLFKGISPIMGEATSKGFIRYTAGLFAKYKNADKVKNKIVNLGYKDAFVVAFFNGKRIPINQAYSMEMGIPPTILRVNNQPQNTTQNTVATNINQTENKTTTVVANETANQQTDFVAPPSVSTISGLFYTVQVGVYAQKVSPTKLFNIDPLYTETAPNGNLRYYTGIYKSTVRATEAMDMVIDVGIKDAFVTAYYNGKRITKAEAKQYEAQGDVVFPTGTNVNKLPVFRSSAKSSFSEPKVNPTESSTNLGDIGIVFKIQIGAFKGEVPLDITNKFTKVADKGIKNYNDKSGLTIYTVGNFRSYDEAAKLQNEVIAAGLTDTFIVAFHNGEKVNVDEARKFIRK